MRTNLSYCVLAGLGLALGDAAPAVIRGAEQPGHAGEESRHAQHHRLLDGHAPTPKLRARIDRLARRLPAGSLRGFAAADELADFFGAG